MVNNKVSGFDMCKTLEWYQSSGVALPSLTGTTLPYSIKQPDLIALSPEYLGALFDLFPQNARDRSILRTVEGKPYSWFHKDSTPELPVPTLDQNDALSDTAIIPSFIDYAAWRESGVPTADIFLYQIFGVSEEVKKIVLAEGFVHEVGHSVVQPALYIEDHTLKFSDGSLVNGLDAMITFAKLSEKHPAISHYASTYRGKDNKFESDDPNYNPKTAISEEMCETIAAYLLGFAFCCDESRSRDPFADRLEIKGFIEEFLNAEIVPK